ncbi:hypothetical protein SMACR_06401 [Sordaria macrospora]|uniref:Uncharacterized protein n=1 Tax=Sordaria macrospora TaxID=5147 RepID=A0A8S8ZG99_SORMA|nr:hypothetical protein SMACR_06401 [Sordaria macrospora]WPJ65716.1 hypothetical protein SMAC4_06401 [Sordaria macrospora]
MDALRSLELRAHRPRDHPGSRLQANRILLRGPSSLDRLGPSATAAPDQVPGHRAGLQVRLHHGPRARGGRRARRQPGRGLLHLFRVRLQPRRSRLRGGLSGLRSATRAAPIRGTGSSSRALAATRSPRGRISGIMSARSSPARPRPRARMPTTGTSMSCRLGWSGMPIGHLWMRARWEIGRAS